MNLIAYLALAVVLGTLLAVVAAAVLQNPKRSTHKPTHRGDDLADRSLAAARDLLSSGAARLRKAMDDNDEAARDRGQG